MKRQWHSIPPMVCEAPAAGRFLFRPGSDPVLALIRALPHGVRARRTFQSGRFGQA